MVEQYLLKHHKSDVLNILKDPDVVKHQAININFVELFENDTNLGNSILKSPEKALGELDNLVRNVQNKLLDESEDTSDLIRKSVHARVYGLPTCPELHRNIFPKNEDLNLFLQITGTVVRVTATKMLEYQRPYICAKCKHVEMIQAVYDQKYTIVPPKRCSNPDSCPGTNLISTGDLNADNCKDYQEIKMQEQTSKLGLDSMPCSMWVTLEDDLVDTCKPGDDVTVCGIIKRRWGSVMPGKRIDVELVLKANHIQVNNSQSSPGLITHEIQEQFASFWEKYKAHPLEGRDLILESFCPKLYGMYIVKLAVALMLAGGSRCIEGNEIGIQLRSEPHLLLVGDPGTGKSQLLRYAAKVIPRSVLTTGVGSTTAGLTVAAVMEDGQWQLEGGALVLADGGICCIDEFNSMKPHDRTSIHEAMEQQTISVAKASIVCKLRTRCSILAATNPKGGHLDPSQPLTLNLALPSPLLSRFDVVLMLKDDYDERWDNLVADHILSGTGTHSVKPNTSLWNLELLQQYFMIIKSVNPVLTPTANRILSSYYQAQRRGTVRNKARTTVRLLDSLIRLSQAHARFMFHTEVHVMDALFAILLIESSMNGECAILMLDKINVQASLPEASMESYVQLAASVLNSLGLQQILKSEMELLKGGYDYKPENVQSHRKSVCTEGGSTAGEILNGSSVFGEDSFLSECVRVPGNELEKENGPQLKSNYENLPKSSRNSPQNSRKSTGKSDLKSHADDENESPNNSSTKPRISFSQFKFSKNVKPKLKQNNKFIKPAMENTEVTTENAKTVDSSVNVMFDTEHYTDDIKNDEFKRSEKKKRKNNINPNKSFKQRKISKQPQANELQMLKLIPSVNDDFDLSILNFGDEQHEIDYALENTKNNTILDQSQIANDKFKENCSTGKEIESTQSNTILLDLKQIEDDKVKKNCSTEKEIRKPELTQKLSQNTKRKQFREKFKFKPRDLPPPVPPDYHKQNSMQMNPSDHELSSKMETSRLLPVLPSFHKQTNTQINPPSFDVNSKKMETTSRTVFESQEQDLESLDFDF